MKDIYEVLRSKEAELEKTRRVIYSLRVVAPLLADDEDVKQAMNSAVAEEAQEKKGVPFP